MERNSFVFYKSFFEAVSDLDDDIRLAYYEAIFRYALNGEESQDNPLVNAMLRLVKPQIEANNKKYENGKKGGRPKKEETEENPEVSEDSGEVVSDEEKPNRNQTETKKNQTETKNNQSETTPEPNVYVNVDDNVNVNDYDNENDNVNVDAEKEKHKKEKSDDFSVCVSIIDYLNARCGTHYKPTTDSTRKSIKGRIRDGYTVEDFKTVIDKKAREWIGSEMEKHLTPETLFRPGNFEKYLNQNIVTKGKNYSERDGGYSELEKLLVEN